MRTPGRSAQRQNVPRLMAAEARRRVSELATEINILRVKLDVSMQDLVLFVLPWPVERRSVHQTLPWMCKLPELYVQDSEPPQRITDNCPLPLDSACHTESGSNVEFSESLGW